MFKSFMFNQDLLLFFAFFLQSFTVVSGVISSCSVLKNAKLFAILNIVCSSLLLLGVSVAIKKYKNSLDRGLHLLILGLSVWITSAYYRVWKGKLPPNFFEFRKDMSQEGMALSGLVLVSVVSLILSGGVSYLFVKTQDYDR